VSFEPILLAPEEVAEEIYPYRRVWQTSWLEILVLLFGVVLILLLTDILHILPDNLGNDLLPRLGIALLPFGAWLLFSYRGERRALQPRPGLLGIVVLGALVANGIAVPLEERLFVPDQWLPHNGFFGRVLGYMLTLGFTAEFLKYAVLRYTVWPQRFHQRLDGIAYALAVSLGFATVYNVRFALFADASLPATALRVASFTFSHLAIGLIIGFALAELRIGHPPVFWLPMNLLLASFVSGLFYAFRNLAIVSGLGVGSTASAPIRGLILALGLVTIMFFIMAFLIESADARMEALTGRRHAL
jgi:RsiW-degrading membrane proteinase PrsW (M82 family)